MGSQALVHELLLDDFVRLLESFFDLPLSLLPMKSQVVRHSNESPANRASMLSPDL